MYIRSLNSQMGADRVNKCFVADIRSRMPELPHVTRARLLAKGLSERDADVLMAIDMGREVGYDGELGQGAVSFFDNVSVLLTFIPTSLGRLLVCGLNKH